MFRLLFENSADSMMILDPETQRFVDCNAAALRMSRGGTREWLLTVPVAQLAPEFQPDGIPSAQKVARTMARALAEGTQRFEWTARGFTGEEFLVEVLMTPQRVGDKTLLVIISRDITERKRSESALRESQQLLTSIADNISEAIWRSGPNHELIFANRAYLRISGYESLEEMQRLPRERLYANPADRARLLHLLACDGVFRNEEIDYLRRDGQHWWGLTHSVAVRDPQTGAVLYYVGSVSDITERKRAQEALLELNATLERRITERTAELAASEERLRTLVEHAPEAIVVFDGATGRFLSGNAHLCRLYGYGADELLQLTPADVSPEFQPDGRRSAELAREKMDEALTGGTPVFEWLHRHSGGRIIPTEVRLVRLPAEDRPLLRASIIDNTERRRREQVQRATFQISEAIHTAENLDGLYRQMHEIISGLMPADNFYIALLDAAAQMFNFPYFVDERDAPPVPMQLSQGLTGYVLRSGKPLLAARGSILRHRSPGVGVVVDGAQETTYQEVGAPAAVWLGAPLTIRDRTFGVVAVQDYHRADAFGEEEKQILTFVAGQIAQAIERKRAEQALRESEEKFRALFEGSSQGVLLHDEHQYLEVNPAAARILGFRSPEELIGRHPRDTAPPFQPGGESSETLAQRHIAECLANGSARFDSIARQPGGRDIPLEVTLTRIEWGGRHIIQAFIQDISERKKVEEELLKSLARERELGQLKSNFISMVSHEFRTPLGVILSSAEILDAYFEQLEPADRREQLQSIQKNTRRMAGLMEEVLVLGMAEAGKLDFRPGSLDLLVFCRRLVEELRSATDGKCPITWTVGDDAVTACADERLLQHIFTNLLSNAVKYSEAGSPVEFRIERHGPDGVCRVQDCGLGIPEADVARMFEVFHRGRNVGHLPGTGLGLTIVKRCVELHRGSLKVESAVGRGTTVTVRLPLFATPPQP